MRPTIRTLLYITVAWCAVVFVYGIVKFPDAPYKPCRSIAGYCGKTGKPHTESEYKQSKVWEGTILVSSPFGLISAIILKRQGRARKTAQTSN